MIYNSTGLDNAEVGIMPPLKSLCLSGGSLFMEEIWKDVAGWEGLYQASTFGRIRSLDRIVNSGRKYSKTSRRKGKILNSFSMSKTKPYLRVTLSLPNNTTFQFVHRLVAIAFIANPENKPQVNHIDGNPFNNCVENLEWSTALDNTRHAHRTGLADSRIDHNGNSKLNSGDILEIRKKYSKKSHTPKELSDEYGVSKTHIWRIVKRQVSKYL